MSQLSPPQWPPGSLELGDPEALVKHDKLTRQICRVCIYVFLDYMHVYHVYIYMHRQRIEQKDKKVSCKTKPYYTIVVNPAVVVLLN